MHKALGSVFSTEREGEGEGGTFRVNQVCVSLRLLEGAGGMCSTLSPPLRTQFWDKREHIDSTLPALFQGLKPQPL